MTLYSDATNNAATPRAQTHARWATRMLFFSMGTIAGTWGVHVPSIKAHFGLDELSLSWVLFAAGLGALLSLMLAGRVVGRWGVASTARLAGLAFCVSVMVLLWLPGRPNMTSPTRRA
jgi:predicted MFS family arabinose efflux permease